jgi:DHA1 family bicyclomycin/chloramphenicol resistance-like MFS transporter
MTVDLETTATGVQLSLTALLVGAGAGQVLFGPWSDRAGRMLPLVVGLVVYVGASVVAAMAPTITVLVSARLVQGVGGAAGMVIGRAMILDRQSGTAAARALNIMMAMTGIAPIVAPLLGSLLVGPLGWRGLLWIITGLAVVSLVATLVVLRETLPRDERDRRAADRETGAWRSLLTVPFVGATLSFAFAMGVLMAYISASPFVYQSVIGMGEVAYGLAFAVNALGMTAATILSTRLSRRYSLRRLAGTSLAISGLGVVMTLVVALTGSDPWLLAIPLFIAIAPLGMVLGNVSAIAMSAVSPRSTGLASAVLGLLQFALAGIVAALVGLGGETTAVPMLIIMLLCAALAASGLVAASRAQGVRHSETVDV